MRLWRHTRRFRWRRTRWAERCSKGLARGSWLKVNLVNEGVKMLSHRIEHVACARMRVRRDSEREAQALRVRAAEAHEQVVHGSAYACRRRVDACNELRGDGEPRVNWRALKTGEDRRMHAKLGVGTMLKPQREQTENVLQRTVCSRAKCN